MAEWKFKQTDFTGGEVSPLFASDTESPMAYTSLVEARNALVHLQGPISRRLGSNFLAEASSGNTNAKVRLIPILDTDNVEKFAVFTGGQVTIFNSTGISEGGTGTAGEEFVNLVRDPDFVLNNGTWVANGNIFENTPVLVSSNGIRVTRRFQSEIMVFAATGGGLDFGFGYGTPYQPATASWWSTSEWEGLIEPYSGTTDASAGLRINWIRQRLEATKTTQQLRYSIECRKIIFPFDEANDPPSDVEMVIKIGTTAGSGNLSTSTVAVSRNENTVLTGTINLTAPLTGVFWLQLEHKIDGITVDGTPITQRIIQMQVHEVKLFAKYTTDTPPAPLVQPYSNEELEDIQFIQSPFGDKQLMLFHRNHAPQSIYRAGGGSWTLAPTVFTGAPTEWVAGGYPSLVATWGARMWVSGSASNPETIWGSKAGDWNTFTAGTGPTDPITFTPTERGAITFLAGQKNLIFGNNKHEFAVASATGVLKPDDTGIVNKQTSYGVRPTPQVISVANSVLLHSSNNQTLRMQRYDDNYEGRRAPDITLRAEHIGARRFRRMFLTREPVQILWCIMLDGTLATMTFDDDLGIYAWTVNDTQGSFEDGFSLVTPEGEEQAVFVVRRTINGTTKRYIEVFRNLVNRGQWTSIDSYVRIFLESTATTITGLDHLEGQKVQYLLDTNYEGEDIVNGGSITFRDTLPTPPAYADVGLGFNFKLQCLPNGPAEAGKVTSNSLDSTKAINRAGVRIVNSRAPIIMGERPPDRSPNSLMDRTEPSNLFTDVSVTNLGSDSTGIVTVEEPLPTRLTVTSIYGKITSNDL